MTSNIGAQRIMTLRRSKYETMARLVRQDAQRELRPEIFARISLIAVFDKLTYDAQCRIAGDMLERERRALLRGGFALETEPSSLDVIIQQGYHEKLGARPMRDATERLVRNAVAHHLLSHGADGGTLRPSADGLRLELAPPTA